MIIKRILLYEFVLLYINTKLMKLKSAILTRCYYILRLYQHKLIYIYKLKCKKKLNFSTIQMSIILRYIFILYSWVLTSSIRLLSTIFDYFLSFLRFSMIYKY